MSDKIKYNLLLTKFTMMLKFIEEIADDGIYDKFENLNELN